MNRSASANERRQPGADEPRRVLDGILFITQPFGGGSRNYCADPATGRRRLALALPQDAEILSADRRFFYDGVTDSTVLVRSPIPGRCRG